MLHETDYDIPPKRSHEPLSTYISYRGGMPIMCASDGCMTELLSHSALFLVCVCVSAHNVLPFKSDETAAVRISMTLLSSLFTDIVP